MKKVEMRNEILTLARDIEAIIESVNYIESQLLSYDRGEFENDWCVDSISSDIRYFRNVLNSNMSSLYKVSSFDEVKSLRSSDLRIRLNRLSNDFNDCNRYVLSLFKIQNDCNRWLLK